MLAGGGTMLGGSAPSSLGPAPLAASFAPPSLVGHPAQLPQHLAPSLAATVPGVGAVPTAGGLGGFGGLGGLGGLGGTAGRAGGGGLPLYTSAAVEHQAPTAEVALSSPPSELEIERKDRVRQETREQVPHLTKMKQKLASLSVSFVRMASDAFLAGWDPDVELRLMHLQGELEQACRSEREMALLDEGALTGSKRSLNDELAIAQHHDDNGLHRDHADPQASPSSYSPYVPPGGSHPADSDDLMSDGEEAE